MGREEGWGREGSRGRVGQREGRVGQVEREGEGRVGQVEGRGMGQVEGEGKG
jgi:hypothetical protein